MVSIERLTRSQLEQKLRDARKVLREIASAPERPQLAARFSRLAGWALEILFDERGAAKETAAPARPQAVEPVEETHEPRASEPRSPELVRLPERRMGTHVGRNRLPEDLVRELLG